MGRPYSVDLRARVVAAYDEGGKPKELAHRFRLSRRTVERLVRRRRETGTIEPLHGKPGPKLVLAGHLDRLQELVKKKPDATLAELREDLGVSAGIATMWRALQSLGLTLKKSHLRSRAATA